MILLVNMTDWDTNTYTEMAQKLATYMGNVVRETGSGTHELAVVHRWQQAMAVSPPDRRDVEALLKLLVTDDSPDGLHGGTAWEEVRLVIDKWAREQGAESSIPQQ